jgi:DNA-binding protein H-NS
MIGLKPTLWSYMFIKITKESLKVFIQKMRQEQDELEAETAKRMQILDQWQAAIQKGKSAPNEVQNEVKNLLKNKFNPVNASS